DHHKRNVRSLIVHRDIIERSTVKYRKFRTRRSGETLDLTSAPRCPPAEHPESQTPEKRIAAVVGLVVDVLCQVNDRSSLKHDRQHVIREIDNVKSICA